MASKYDQFKLVTDFELLGDQARAIDELVEETGAGELAVQRRPAFGEDVFDAAETFSSVASRNTTTTATQSLMMINGDWPLKRAAAFAQSLAGI